MQTKYQQTDSKMGINKNQVMHFVCQLPHCTFLHMAKIFEQFLAEFNWKRYHALHN